LFAQSEVKKYLRIKLRRARMPRERYRRDFRNMAGFLPMKINRERNRKTIESIGSRYAFLGLSVSVFSLPIILSRLPRRV